MVENGTPPGWRRSTRCGESGCVEVAFVERGSLVRDSKIDDSPVLSFGPESWAAFVAAVRAGEFG
jgi:hypothetical protein